MTVASYSHFGATSVNGLVMEFQSCGITMQGTPLIVRDGLRASLDSEAADVRNGPYYYGGPLVIQPSSAQLAALAALAMANATTGVMTEFDVVVDRDYNVVTYEDMKVNTFTLRGSQGGIYEVTLDLVGKTANTSGSVEAVTEAAPLIFADTTLTIGNTAYEVMEIELIVNNNLRNDRWANALTLSDIAPAAKRVISLRTVHAFMNTNSALWATTATQFNTNTLVLNDSVNTTTFTFGALQAPREDPPLGDGEVMLTKNWTARATGNTEAIAVA